jgi:hypothetical protein
MVNLNIFTPEDAAAVANAVKASDKGGQAIAEEGQTRVGGETPQVSADDVYGKLLKIVPVPLLGFYLAFENLWFTVADDDRHEILFVTASYKQFAAWATLVVFVVLVPLFLHQNKVHRWTQMVMASLAFVVLATSSQGPFQLIGAWKDWIGTAALLAMGVALLFYQPNKLPDNVIPRSQP